MIGVANSGFAGAPRIFESDRSLIIPFSEKHAVRDSSEYIVGLSGYTNYSPVLIHSLLLDGTAKLGISEVDDEILICFLLSQYTCAKSETCS